MHGMPQGKVTMAHVHSNPSIDSQPVALSHLVPGALAPKATSMAGIGRKLKKIGLFRLASQEAKRNPSFNLSPSISMRQISGGQDTGTTGLPTASNNIFQ